jgi:hypothetical protein
MTKRNRNRSTRQTATAGSGIITVTLTSPLTGRPVTLNSPEAAGETWLLNTIAPLLREAASMSGNTSGMRSGIQVARTAGGANVTGSKPNADTVANITEDVLRSHGTKRVPFAALRAEVAKLCQMDIPASLLVQSIAILTARGSVTRHGGGRYGAYAWQQSAGVPAFAQHTMSNGAQAQA